MSKSKFLTMNYMVHDLNHTQTSRVGNLATAHLSDSNMITTLTDYSAGVQYQNLNPGIYYIEIDGLFYAFDLYWPIENDDYVEIDAYNKAFCRYAMNYYPIWLYHVSDLTHDYASQYIVRNTVNNWFDLLLVDGHSELNTTSSKNTTPSLTKPIGIKSITTLTFNSRNLLSNDITTTEIKIRNYIKSLPNGVKDSCIINSELQRYHLVTRVGRTVFSGYDAWSELTAYSTDDYGVFYCANSNVALQDKANNIFCTHLPVLSSSNLLSTAVRGNYIATCGNKSIGNGFLMKIATDELDYQDRQTHLFCFQQWLSEIFTSGNAMIVEYPLASYDYRTLLLEEYHVPTFYSSTVFSLTNTDDCNVSYFYKTLP